MQNHVYGVKSQIDDRKISTAIMTSFVILTIQYFFLIVFELKDTSLGFRLQLISKIFVSVVYLYSLPTVIKKNKFKFIIVYYIAILIFLVNYLLFPANSKFLSQIIFPFFFTSLPAFLYTLSLDNLNVLKETMKKGSLTIFIFGSILITLVLLGKASVGIYSMSLSYYMLFPAIVFLNELFEKFSFKNFFIMLFSLFIIFIIGSRGALLCVAMFILLKLIKGNYNFGYRKVYFNFSFVGFSIFVILNFNRLLELSHNLLLMSGINSRTITLLLTNAVSLSGRDKIYQHILNEIAKRPFLGIGIAGDRTIESGYTHNFFLEILSNFGIILGSIIIILIMLLIFKALSTKYADEYDMVAIWLCLGFVHLTVSSSYLIDMKFWIFIALLFKVTLNKSTTGKAM